RARRTPAGPGARRARGPPSSSRSRSGRPRSDPARRRPARPPSRRTRGRAFEAVVAPRSGRSSYRLEPFEIEDRRRAVRPEDGPDATPDVGRSEEPVQQDGVGAVEPDEREREGRIERRTVDVPTCDGPRLDGSLGTAFRVGNEPGEAAFAEDPCRQVRDAAIGAPRTEERSAVTERLEERRVAHPGRVAERHRELSFDPADGHGMYSAVAAATSSRRSVRSRGRKYAISRIEPVRSSRGRHTASTASPIRTSSGATSPSLWRKPPSLDPSILITAGSSGSSSGRMSHVTWQIENVSTVP